MDEFFKFLGNSRAELIDLAVMDMWKAFRNSTQRNAPNAQIIYDKFHIMSHLSKALDQVRRDEYPYCLMSGTLLSVLVLLSSVVPSNSSPDSPFRYNKSSFTM